MLVSEIGYGTWGIGGIVNGMMSYGPRDDAQSDKSLELAYDLGVTLYDTASSYGFGHSEVLLGKMFCKRRSKIIISTKAGFLNSFPSGCKNKNQDFSAKNIKTSILNSLKRLKTDYIDLFQLHSPDYSHLSNNDDLFLLLDNLKKKGLIRYVGLAAKSPSDVMRMLKIYKFDSVQTNFNLTDMRIIDNGLIKYCDAHKLALITRTPLVYGFLTGTFNSSSKFHSSDHRTRFSKEQVNKWCSALEIYKDNFNNLKADYTLAQKAIKFCLSFDQVSTVLSGMDIPKYVIENLSSSDVNHLSNCELMDIYAKYVDNFRCASPKTI